MQRLVVNVMTGEQHMVDLTPEEIAALPNPEPEPIVYPTEAIVADRVTNEPYELFIANGKLNSVKMEE